MDKTSLLVIMIYSKNAGLPIQESIEGEQETIKYTSFGLHTINSRFPEIYLTANQSPILNVFLFIYHIIHQRNASRVLNLISTVLLQNVGNICMLYI